jgi:YD repeat-containing protein
MGGTNGGGDPVELATGQDAYLPAPDIAVYNPNGPAAVFQRNWWSAVTMNYGYNSPCLSAGWVNNYDLSIQVIGGVYTLVYPNGAQEALNSSNGSGPTGSPYRATFNYSLDGSSVVRIIITFNDGTEWIFQPNTNTGNFALTSIVNKMGRSINIQWGAYQDPNFGPWARVTSVTDDVGNTLLTFNYAGTQLASVVDIYGRKVNYTFDSLGRLSAVSQILSAGATGNPNRWQYQYLQDQGPIPPTGPTAMYYPHLTSVSFINSAGTTSTQTISYQLTTESQSTSGIPANSFGAYVNQTVDGNGNITNYTYAYNSSDNWHPTSITDKNGHITQLTWDQYGKLTSCQTPKGTTTTLAYNYSTFLPGRLMSVTEGSKTPISFTYNEPSGLVKTVSYPTPGTSGGGSQSTVSYTYDALGNMLTKTYPGPNGNITITCNYTSDGLFTQQEKLGLPLTVTDPQGNTTHLRYDSRGNLSTIIDPLGKEVDKFFNTADNHHPADEDPVAACQAEC